MGRTHDDAAAFGISLFEVFQAFEVDKVPKIGLIDEGIAQDFDEHAPETGNALLGDAFCFSLRHAKTFLDVFLGHIAPPFGCSQPANLAQGIGQGIIEAGWLHAGNPAHQFHEGIRKHCSSASLRQGLLLWHPFRGNELPRALERMRRCLGTNQPKGGRGPFS